MKHLQASELILNPDGSIYHLHLHPRDIADTIILVGDQDRVPTVSGFFDSIDFKIRNREFVTHTGTYKGKRITALSTGIGTDNIDIVVNELDALVNIDLDKRKIKEQKSSLNLIRLGTSGALHEDIPVDSFVASKMAIGFDGLLNFYANRHIIANTEIEAAFLKHTNWNKMLATPYFVDSSDTLYETIAFDMVEGLTVSAPGFFGPQGRILRLDLQDDELNEKLRRFEFNGQRITNYEMEGSAIYGLSKLMSHNALTICTIIANRYRKEYSSDYKKTVEKMIAVVLDRLVG